MSKYSKTAACRPAFERVAENTRSVKSNANKAKQSFSYSKSKSGSLDTNYKLVKALSELNEILGTLVSEIKAFPNEAERQAKRIDELELDELQKRAENYKVNKYFDNF